MDEIAERLKKVVDEHGPEGMAVSMAGRSNPGFKPEPRACYSSGISSSFKCHVLSAWAVIAKINAGFE